MCYSIMTVTLNAPNLVEMRDISADLRSRIALLEKAREVEIARFQDAQEKAATEHKQKVDQVNKTIANYRNMLDLEEFMASSNIVGAGRMVGPMPEIKMPVSRLPLPEFFIEELNRRGAMTKEELRQAAQSAGYFTDSGGRSTHVTLENIKRSNRVILGADGKYTANTLEKALL